MYVECSYESGDEVTIARVTGARVTGGCITGHHVTGARVGTRAPITR